MNKKKHTQTQNTKKSLIIKLKDLPGIVRQMYTLIRQPSIYASLSSVSKIPVRGVVMVLLLLLMFFYRTKRGEKREREKKRFCFIETYCFH